MFSERHRYILKLLVYLANQCDQSYCKMSELSETLSIPRGYLNRIIPELVELGIVESKKGKGGGVKLEKAPHKIQLRELLEDTGALSHRTEETYEACCIPEEFSNCMIDLWMDDFKESVLGDTTLEELTKRLI